MPKRSIVPFGPQHPVLPEPIHLDLVLEDEKVIEAIPSSGYVHRGLESLVAKKDFNEMADVVEEFMQKYCNPQTTIIAKLDGIEWVQSEVAKSFEVLD